MKYKIAICDDSDADREYVLNMVNRWAAGAGQVVLLILSRLLKTSYSTMLRKVTTIFCSWILKWVIWTV